MERGSKILWDEVETRRNLDSGHKKWRKDADTEGIGTSNVAAEGNYRRK